MYLFQVMSSCKVRVLMKLLCSSAFFMPACYRTEISGKVTTAPDASILLSGFRHHRDSVMVPGKKKNKNDWALVGRNTVPRIPSYLQPLFFNHTAGTLSALLLRDRRVWQCKSHLRESTFQWKPHFPWVLTLRPREWRCICDPQTC